MQPVTGIGTENGEASIDESPQQSVMGRDVYQQHCYVVRSTLQKPHC